MSEEKKESAMSEEEEIGYHKGALQTLVNERNELIKIIQITEALVQAHLKRLKELGVEIKASTTSAESQNDNKKRMP